jgi:predicted 3-demethylubiquinone-9 3-methyltransferase (glyoxalase superfamily)
MDVTPFLGFDGNAVAALEHYTQVFPETENEEVVRGPDGRERAYEGR